MTGSLKVDCEGNTGGIGHGPFRRGPVDRLHERRDARWQCSVFEGFQNGADRLPDSAVSPDGGAGQRFPKPLPPDGFHGLSARQPLAWQRKAGESASIVACHKEQVNYKYHLASRANIHSKSSRSSPALSSKSVPPANKEGPAASGMPGSADPAKTGATTSSCGRVRRPAHNEVERPAHNEVGRLAHNGLGHNGALGPNLQTPGPRLPAAAGSCWARWRVLSKVVKPRRGFPRPSRCRRLPAGRWTWPGRETRPQRGETELWPGLLTRTQREQTRTQRQPWCAIRRRPDHPIPAFGTRKPPVGSTYGTRWSAYFPLAPFPGRAKRLSPGCRRPCFELACC